MQIEYKDWFFCVQKFSFCHIKYLLLKFESINLLKIMNFCLLMLRNAASVTSNNCNCNSHIAIICNTIHCHERSHHVRKKSLISLYSGITFFSNSKKCYWNFCIGISHHTIHHHKRYRYSMKIWSFFSC